MNIRLTVIMAYWKYQLVLNTFFRSGPTCIQHAAHKLHILCVFNCNKSFIKFNKPTNIQNINVDLSKNIHRSSIHSVHYKNVLFTLSFFHLVNEHKLQWWCWYSIILILLNQNTNFQSDFLKISLIFVAQYVYLEPCQ